MRWFICAALVLSTSAHAGSGRFYCEGAPPDLVIVVNLGAKQNSVALMGKGTERDHVLGTFPTRQRHIEIRSGDWLPILRVDTKGPTVTLDGKPCDMRGWDD